MKRTITTVLAALITAVLHAQTITSANLGNTNNVSAWISNNGTLFWNQNDQGYEVPLNSGDRILSFMNVMAMGEDLNGQLKGAITGYPHGDYFRGPIATNYNDPDYLDRWFMSIWWMYQSNIDYHIAHWSDPGYTVPSYLANWPSNGNTANGESAILAPFHDGNNNGLYEPALGEYPIIRGDAAVYTIFNDAAGLHESGSDPIGMEVHLMAYQYGTDNALNNTTFVHVEVINRGTLTINDFQFGSHVDFDLGNSEDDFLGTASGENMAYVYNADSIDNGYYGETPPAAGVITLNKPLYAHVSEDVNMYDLNIHEVRNLFSGKLSNGDPQLNHEGEPFLHFCPGLREQGWTELSQPNGFFDRRSMISFPPETFGPGDQSCFDYAVVYAENSVEGDLFSPVDSLLEVADFVQSFFNEQQFDCFPNFLSTGEQELTALSVFPNPARTHLSVTAADGTAFEILTLDGKQVKSGRIIQATIPVDDLPNGCYLLRLPEGIARFIRQD